jgi:microcystin-dependent protein
MLDSDLSFTLAGPFVEWPTGGDAGPFTLAMDDGLPTVEKILCSALDTGTGVVTVYVDGDFNGRGYDGTTANAHTPQAAPNPQCRPCWTAEEASEANDVVVAVMGAAASAADGTVLTVESGVPVFEAPGGGNGLFPIGGMIAWPATAAAPAGTHVADGSAISRTTYADLFGLYGTTWGVGDGSTTFNLPNMEGLFPLGAGGTIGATVGETGGSETISTPQLPVHNHPDSGHEHLAYVAEVGTAAQGIYTDDTDVGNVYAIPQTGSAGAGPLLVANADTVHWQTADADNAAAGEGEAFVPPYAAMQWIIRIA